MADSPRFYLTTAIDYPNSRPHIGTAFEKIGADVQARYPPHGGLRRPLPDGQRREHHQGRRKRAAELGRRAARPTATTWPASSRRSGRRSRSASTTSSRPASRATTPAAGSSSRRSTTPATSTRGVLRGLVLRRLRGVQDREGARRTAASARTTRRPLRPAEEESYFFRALGVPATACWRYYEANPDFIQPESRRNEIVNLVEVGPAGRQRSRRKGFTWGIRVPFDPEYTIYVWFDALLNYITAIGYGDDEARFRQAAGRPTSTSSARTSRGSTAPSGRRCCCAAGLPLPKQVFGHGFVYRKNEETARSRRSARSLGNVVEPMDIITKFIGRGVPLLLHERVPVRRRRRVQLASGSPRSTTPTWRTTSATSTAAS